MTIRINGWHIAGNAQKVNSDWNATDGYAQILNKPTNLVHTTDNEVIGGIKTFATIPLSVTPVPTSNDTSVATTEFVQNRVTQHELSDNAHPEMRRDIITLSTSLAEEMNIRSDDDDYLQQQIDAITASADIKDIVGTYQDLVNYPASQLNPNDIVKVLNDETHEHSSTYYKWKLNGSILAWEYIGSESTYYTKAESDTNYYYKSYIDTNLVYNTTTINTHPLISNITLKLSDLQDDIGYALNNKVVHTTGDETIAGTKTFTSVIQGTAYRAQWGDLAENYLTDKIYPKGTLVMFGGEKELTIASNKVNAVITSEPGFILNSKEEGQGIALMGRVPVRIIGKVKKFDKISLSYIDGVGCVNNDTETPLGIALQDKAYDDEGLVLCSVRMTF